MASTHPTSKAPGAPQKPAEDHPSKQAQGHAPEAHGQPAARPAPPPEQTVADEQRERSDEIQRAGVDKWREAHDERTAEEKAGGPVPGATGANPEAGTWAGSTRSTPPAREAQKKP